MKKYYAEFFGTAILVLMACGSAVLAGPVIGTLGIGLCFGLVLFGLCYTIGGISGCHVNPAVSFGVWLTDRNFTFREMIGYWIAQFAGAAFGAMLLYWIYAYGAGAPAGELFSFGGITDQIGFSDKSSFLATNVLQKGVTWEMALLTEILFTFVFVLVVLGSTSKAGNSTMAGAAIGLTLGLVNIVGIPVDNCSVNPARSFGPALFSTNAWPDFWIMVVGPLVGAALASIVWQTIRPKDQLQAA